MPPGVTATKERGCFQCSRRRIICDRAEPSCLKCAKKGIACSGLGRIRFAGAVASRGRFKGCQIPKIGEGEGKRHVEESLSAKEPTKPSTDAPEDQSDGARLIIFPPNPIKSVVVQDAQVEDVCRSSYPIIIAHTYNSNIIPWIAPIEATSRLLFSYCMQSFHLFSSLKCSLITKQSPMSSLRSWSCLMTPRMAIAR